jgi:hypothetical protein
MIKLTIKTITTRKKALITTEADKSAIRLTPQAASTAPNKQAQVNIFASSLSGSGSPQATFQTACRV